MFCTQCGQQTPEEALYCSRCGKAAKTNPGGGAPKRLFRLRDDKKIAGICAGLAKYLDVDVTLVRILTVATVCVTGFLPGLVAYVVVWAIMPLEEPLGRTMHTGEPAHTNAG
jgi:phage shock protein C